MLGVWEGQSRVANSVPHTALIPSNDIYDNGAAPGAVEKVDEQTGWPLAGGSNPHPPNRPLVADRLAKVALARCYNVALGEVLPPMYASHRIDGNQVLITFKQGGAGLSTANGEALTWFEVSADGKVYVKANARITAFDTITVSADAVVQPRFVRFAWHTLSRHNLIGSQGLPAIPFRTVTP